MSLENNPKYQLVYTSAVHGLKLYMPVDIVNGYHFTRYQAATFQGMYAASGATKELTSSIYNTIKKMCEEAHGKKDVKTFMDINTLMDNLLYRHQYPVDGDCLLRMGAIYVLLEDEDPDDYQQSTTQRKEDYCKGRSIPGDNNYLKPDYDMYSFFLTWGQRFTDVYKEQLTDTTDVAEYLNKREEALRGLIPAQLQPKSTT